MRNTVRSVLLLGVLSILMGINPAAVSAGFLDKLNAATDKLNRTSQQMDQKSQQIQQVQNTFSRNTAKFEKTKTTNAITGGWGNQVTCAGPNSATCQNGMDNLVNCMHQTKGYYYRLVAANLEAKLENEKGLSGQEREDLATDLAAVQKAIDTGNVVDPDPQDPQRWLARLTDDDQMQINSANSKYMREVHDDCDSRFGGMAKFSR